MKRYLILVSVGIFILSCTHKEVLEKHKIERTIYAVAESDIFLPIANFHIQVKLDSIVSGRDTFPISGAEVIVNNHTLEEVEAGRYEIGWVEVFPWFDTLNFKIILSGDSVLYSLPMPNSPILTINSPISYDTISAGEDLSVVWGRVTNVNFYNIQLFQLRKFPPETSDLIFYSFTKDTSLVIPGEYIVQDSLLILVEGIAGPQLLDGDIEPNYNQDDWKGIFMGKCKGYVIVKGR